MDNKDIKDMTEEENKRDYSNRNMFELKCLCGQIEEIYANVMQPTIVATCNACNKSYTVEVVPTQVMISADEVWHDYGTPELNVHEIEEEILQDMIKDDDDLIRIHFGEKGGE